MMPSRPLRVLQLAVTDQGGAGMACIRLHRAFLGLNVDSRVLVRRLYGSDEGITQAGSRWNAALRFRLDRLPLYLYPRKNVFGWWSVNWLPDTPRIEFGDWRPDIIHAHWIGDGYVPVEWFAKAGRPVVWTMHDMWPFTGGCHYAQDCLRYETGCGECPQLGSTSKRDMSFRSAARKARAWGSANGATIAPSLWLADVARKSSVLRNTRIEVIPYGLDGSVFRPANRADARKRLGLPQGERILLTGALNALKDERKGFGLLKEALRTCYAAGGTEKWRLLVFGADAGPGVETIGIPVTYCGTVSGDRDLATIYQACDVFALPSLQDNLPNTAIEALACGKPVVAFRSSGLATMIQNGRTGWLAEPFSSDSLGIAIRNAMDASFGEEWSAACREEFDRTYAWPGPAHRHLRLYEEMLRNRQRNGRPYTDGN